MTKFGGLVAFFTCLCFDASVNAGQCGQSVRGMVGGEDVDQTTNSECFNSSFVCVRAELEVIVSRTKWYESITVRTNFTTHFVQNSEHTSIFLCYF